MSPTAHQVPPSLFMPNRPFPLTTALTSGTARPAPAPCIGVLCIYLPRAAIVFALANFWIFLVQYCLTPERRTEWMGTRMPQLGAFL